MIMAHAETLKTSAETRQQQREAQVAYSRKQERYQKLAERHARQRTEALLSAARANPRKFVVLGKRDHFISISSPATEEFRRAWDKDHPEPKQPPKETLNHYAYVQFPALNCNVHVVTQAHENAFKALASQIDALYLKGDAEGLAKTITDALAKLK